MLEDFVAQPDCVGRRIRQLLSDFWFGEAFGNDDVEAADRGFVPKTSWQNYWITGSTSKHL